MIDPVFDFTFPTALGDPQASAHLKTRAEDFIVEETLSFPLRGEGKHLYLQVQKTQANTQWVARELARRFKVPPRDVGYAGLKDRHAVTTQWFSIPIRPQGMPPVSDVTIEGVTLLQAVAHDRKLRKGAVLHNTFTITLRDVHGDVQDVMERLAQIRMQGVPNYFDAQRFGHDRHNLNMAQKLFARQIKAPPYKRGLYLSAARAWLFNHILAQRIRERTWNQALAGDVFWLNGTRRFFTAERIDADIIERVQQGDIHPTGALWGEGALLSADSVAELETGVATQWTNLRDGLEHFGLQQDRRALRVLPQALTYEWDAYKKSLQVTFRLPAGSYATTLLGEVVSVVTPSSRELEVSDEGLQL